jgi:hypothetical protein
MNVLSASIIWIYLKQALHSRFFHSDRMNFIKLFLLLLMFSLILEILIFFLCSTFIASFYRTVSMRAFLWSSVIYNWV